MEQSIQTASPRKLWNELSYFELGLIILMVGYFFYLNNSTGWVINYNNSTNGSRIVNGVENKPGTVLYGQNDYVPKSAVSNSQTFFGIVLFLIVIFVILSKLVKSLRRATIGEAINDISKQLIEVRQLREARITVIKNGVRIVSDFEEIDLTYNFLTRYKSIGDVREAFRYTINVQIKNKQDETDEYYRAYYHPWSRYWDGMVKSITELTESDQCPNCGKEYHEKIIISDDLKKMRYIKETIPGVRL